VLQETAKSIADEGRRLGRGAPQLALGWLLTTLQRARRRGGKKAISAGVEGRSCARAHYLADARGALPRKRVLPEWVL
jgi:hypothetical protein